MKENENINTEISDLGIFKKFLALIPVTTVLFAYIFICSILYLIGFWSHFNVDALSLISISDIPKHFIYVFLLVQLPILIDVLFERPLINLHNFEIVSSIRRFIYFFVCIIILIISFFIFEKPFHEPTFIFLLSFLTACFFMFFFVNNKELMKQIRKDHHRTYLAYISIFFPIMSYGIGNMDGLKIYNNSNLTYVKLDNVNDTTQYKNIGFVSDYFLYGTLNNDKVFIINKSDYKNISISKKKFKINSIKQSGMTEAEIIRYCLTKMEDKDFFKWSIGITNEKNILPLGNDFHIWKCSSYEEANNLRLYLILNKQMDNYTPHPTGDETFIYVSKIR
jgi:hypothetical protein